MKIITIRDLIAAGLVKVDVDENDDATLETVSLSIRVVTSWKTWNANGPKIPKYTKPLVYHVHNGIVGNPKTGWYPQDWEWDGFPPIPPQDILDGPIVQMNTQWQANDITVVVDAGL